MDAVGSPSAVVDEAFESKKFIPIPAPFDKHRLLPLKDSPLTVGGAADGKEILLIADALRYRPALRELLDATQDDSVAGRNKDSASLDAAIADLFASQPRGLGKEFTEKAFVGAI
jgi:hypothetical protein